VRKYATQFDTGRIPWNRLIKLSGRRPTRSSIGCNSWFRAVAAEIEAVKETYADINRNSKAIQMRLFGDRREALDWAGAKASDAN
jgi:hypothetical protein